MLSLGDEQWDDYYGQALGSPVRNIYDVDDSESSDESSYSCEPLSPPRSSILTNSLPYGKMPEFQRSLSPRSVQEENLDTPVLFSSSWMCIYDLDSLCLQGHAFSPIDPSQMLRKSEAGLIPHVVDLFNSNPHSEEKDNLEAHRDNLPIQTVLPAQTVNEPAETSSAHRIQRRYRYRRSRTKLNDPFNNRCVIVESFCKAIPEIEETEEVETIYMRVRYLPPPILLTNVSPPSHILFCSFLYSNNNSSSKHRLRQETN